MVFATHAPLTGWNVNSGKWEVKSGLGDAKDNLGADAATTSTDFEKTGSFDVSFAPGQTTVYEFTLKEPGDIVETRPDIGIGTDDLKIRGNTLSLTVHSLGAKDAPAGWARILDENGKVVSRASIPKLAAPIDLKPHTTKVKLTLPAANRSKRYRVNVTLGDVKEITQMNNSLQIP